MITTLITTYQRPSLLKRAVESALNQTIRDVQVHIFDDASGDETGSVAEALCKQDSRVHYHCHPKRVGMMENYRLAFASVTTPYFHFFSDDDYLFPWFLETALGALDVVPEAAFSACGISAMNEEGVVVADPLGLWRQEGVFPAQAGLLEMVGHNNAKYPFPAGVLFRTKYVQENPPDLGEEIQLFWDPNYLMLLAGAFPIVIRKKQCGIFSVHAGSFSSSIYGAALQESNVEKYFRAVGKTARHLREARFLSSVTSRQAQTLFRKAVLGHTLACLKKALSSGNFRTARFIFKKYRESFGFSVWDGITVFKRVFRFVLTLRV